MHTKINRCKMFIWRCSVCGCWCWNIVASSTYVIRVPLHKSSILQYKIAWWRHQMLTIFRVTGPLWGAFIGHQWIPLTKSVTRSFDVFFDLRLNKRLSKQSRWWWFEIWNLCSMVHVPTPLSSRYIFHQQYNAHTLHTDILHTDFILKTRC